MFSRTSEDTDYFGFSEEDDFLSPNPGNRSISSLIVQSYTPRDIFQMMDDAGLFKPLPLKGITLSDIELRVDTSDMFVHKLYFHLAPVSFPFTMKPYTFSDYRDSINEKTGSEKGGKTDKKAALTSQASQTPQVLSTAYVSTPSYLFSFLDRQPPDTSSSFHGASAIVTEGKTVEKETANPPSQPGFFSRLFSRAFGQKKQDPPPQPSDQQASSTTAAPATGPVAISPPSISADSDNPGNAPDANATESVPTAFSDVLTSHSYPAESVQIEQIVSLPLHSSAVVFEHIHSPQQSTSISKPSIYDRLLAFLAIRYTPSLFITSLSSYQAFLSSILSLLNHSGLHSSQNLSSDNLTQTRQPHPSSLPSPSSLPPNTPQYLISLISCFDSLSSLSLACLTVEYLVMQNPLRTFAPAPSTSDYATQATTTSPSASSTHRHTHSRSSLSQTSQPSNVLAPATYPPLPGQRHPGLGIGRTFLPFIKAQNERKKRDLIISKPEFFHNAILYDEFHFLLPQAESWFLFLFWGVIKAIRGRGLSAVSYAIHLGCCWEECVIPREWALMEIEREKERENEGKEIGSTTKIIRDYEEKEGGVGAFFSSLIAGMRERSDEKSKQVERIPTPLTPSIGSTASAVSEIEERGNEELSFTQVLSPFYTPPPDETSTTDWTDLVVAQIPIRWHRMDFLFPSSSRTKKFFQGEWKKLVKEHTKSRFTNRHSKVVIDWDLFRKRDPNRPPTEFRTERRERKRTHINQTSTHTTPMRQHLEEEQMAEFEQIPRDDGDESLVDTAESDNMQSDESYEEEERDESGKDELKEMEAEQMEQSETPSIAIKQSPLGVLTEIQQMKQMEAYEKRRRNTEGKTRREEKRKEEERRRGEEEKSDSAGERNRTAGAVGSGGHNDEEGNTAPINSPDVGAVQDDQQNG
ncbi:hypothetical protein BLNAU_2724 [Blattamonas nauphoetae]|uniref:Uncharacterized protein n=1 Tax=Blattamonas nauphoetae TaxID=2049346 RepID=A0ABQ9YFS2_9EUKA|nr:hypothetical protein BLNAU_2724 [Blattamonas nauphoetae]